MITDLEVLCACLLLHLFFFMIHPLQEFPLFWFYYFHIVSFYNCLEMMGTIPLFTVSFTNVLFQSLASVFMFLVISLEEHNFWTLIQFYLSIELYNLCFSYCTEAILTYAYIIKFFLLYFLSEMFVFQV